MLWVFGDSYGHLNQTEFEILKDWHWISCLSQSLTNGEFRTFCAHGAANEWIFYQFLINLENIKEEDYVVIISSQINRRWFFQNNIGASNLSVINSSTESLNTNEKDAVISYLKYLENPILNPLFFSMFCYSIHYLTVVKNLKLVVLPGFEEDKFPVSGKYQTKGSLFDICVNEIKGKSVQKWRNFISNIHKGIDPRIGHISPDNHKVLTEKLKNTFLYGECLDLTNGFLEEIV